MMFTYCFTDCQHVLHFVLAYLHSIHLRLNLSLEINFSQTTNCSYFSIS